MKFKYSDHVLDQDTNKLLFWHYDIYFKQMLWRDEVSSLPVLNSNELIVIQLKLWAVRAIGDRSMEAVNHRGQMGIFTLLEHFLNYKLWFSATSKIDLTEGNPKRYCRYVTSIICTICPLFHIGVATEAWVIIVNIILPRKTFSPMASTCSWKTV